VDVAEARCCPDGTRVATASDDQTARVWGVSRDTGTLADWRTTLERSDYFLNDQCVLILRDPMAQIRHHHHPPLPPIRIYY